MGLQSKTGAGIYTQVRQSYRGEPHGFGREGRENHWALAEERGRTTQLWQSGDPMEVTQLMVPSTSFPEIRYP